MKKRLFYIGVGVAACFLLFLILAHNTSENVQYAVEFMNDSAINRLKTFEVKPVGFKKSAEVITFEVDMTETTQIDDSWTTWDIFRKSQSVTFYAKGLYTVDLKQVQSEDVTINPSNNTVSISIERPRVKTITIDESKTVYTTPNSGLFRSDQYIKLTVPDQQVITAKVKEAMAEKMLSAELMQKAEESTKQSLEELYGEFTAIVLEGYQVEILWK